MNSKCIDCGQRLRIITSINGSQIPVNYVYAGVWVADADRKSGRYVHKSGFMPHHKTCKAKERYRGRS